jgi:hypothetical protein
MLLANVSSQDNDNTTKNYLQNITKPDFQVFIENKVMKNFLVSSLIEKETDSDIFKAFMLEIYDSLVLCSIDAFKRKNPGVKVKKGQIKSIKKLDIIAVGILLACATNRSKIDFLYNLFSQEEGYFKHSEDLEDFLYFLFIIPSTCGFRSIKNLGEKFPEQMDSLSNEEFYKKLDAFEIEDIHRLKGIFITDFFKGSNRLSKNEFESRFVTATGEENFGWIFSSSGIRFMLEKNNDVKKPEVVEGGEVENKSQA